MFYFPVIRKNLPIYSNANCQAIIEHLSKATDNTVVLHSDITSASFLANNRNFMFHNSFLPVCKISISEADNIERLHVQFHLQISVQIGLWVYMFMAFLMQAAIVVMAFKDCSMPLLVALLPTVLMLYAAGFSYLGLIIFSHRLIKIIKQAANRTPKQ